MPNFGDYSHGGLKAHQFLVLGDSGVGVSVSGTIASAAVLAQIRVPRAIRVTGCSSYCVTGGTAAGPSYTVGYSLAGTGAYTAFGTATIVKSSGTGANNTGADCTVTETNLAAGDMLIIKSVAGTAAATPVANWTITFQELFA